jgi:hypothetical protein
VRRCRLHASTKSATRPCRAWSPPSSDT